MKTNKQISKNEVLYIRACKGSNALLRLRKLYSKDHLVYKEKCMSGYYDVYICSKLIKLTEQINPISNSDLLNNMAPHNVWTFGVSDEDSHWTKALKIIISHFAQTEVSRIPGWVAPLKFRGRDAANAEQEKVA